MFLKKTSCKKAVFIFVLFCNCYKNDALHIVRSFKLCISSMKTTLVDGVLVQHILRLKVKGQHYLHILEH